MNERGQRVPSPNVPIGVEEGKGSGMEDGIDSLIEPNNTQYL